MDIDETDPNSQMDIDKNDNDNSDVIKLDGDMPLSETQGKTKINIQRQNNDHMSNTEQTQKRSPTTKQTNAQNQPTARIITADQINEDTPDDVMLEYIQQEMTRCMRQGKKAMVKKDGTFEKYNTEYMLWRERLNLYTESSKKASSSKAVPSTNGATMTKDQRENAPLQDLVNMPAFKKDLPAFQITGEKRHDKKKPKFSCVADFEEFEIILKAYRVPIQGHWQQCIMFTCAPGQRT